MNPRKMRIKKRAVLQVVDERDGWFVSSDLVSRVGEILGEKSSFNVVGAYLSQLFEDGYLTRERSVDEYGNRRYRYCKREGILS